MLLTVISFFDKQLKRYTSPGYDDHSDPEVIKELVRTQIVKLDPIKRKVYEEKNLVVLGTFDTETGKHECHDPEFLLNCDEVISQVQDYERNKSNNGQEA